MEKRKLLTEPLSLQFKDETSLQTQNRLLVEQHDEIQELISQICLEIWRTEYSKDKVASMASGWATHFTEAGIPTGKIGDVYIRAVSNLEKGEYFSLANLLSAWKELKQELEEEKLKEHLTLVNRCQICRGKKEIVVFNFATKKEEVKRCDCTY